MADESVLIGLIVVGLVLLIFYLYIASIGKVLGQIGFTRQEISVILLVTFLLGWITIPLVPVGGWWVGISLGGALVPLILCFLMVKSGRVKLPEMLIGVVIVTYISYFVTRPEEGVGIVADLPLAFAPALAAGLYSISTFWTSIDRAAPLAYASGIIGTIVGADLMHLSEVLAFTPPEDGLTVLSIGGANILDMVYLTGIVAVGVDIFVFWIKRQQLKRGMWPSIIEFQRGPEDLPVAREHAPEPTLKPGRKGRL
ncbi:MAG: DUF1614 domain-containing protein [Thermoplasmata archaeon]